MTGANACPILGTPDRPLLPAFLPHLEDGTLRICSWPPWEDQARQARS